MAKESTPAYARMIANACKGQAAPLTDVRGKVAFITGGSSGIGLGIAQAFINAGMKVVITYRTPTHLEQAVKSIGQVDGRLHAIRVDVTDRIGMEHAAEEAAQVFGKIHVLVNNAGVLHQLSLRDMTYSDWDWVMGVNLTGVFNGLRAFLPRILEHDEGGQIITTASMMGLFAGPGSYSASKYGVVGMMESLRAEVANQRIGVSILCPGVVRSEITRSERNRPNSLGIESSDTTKSLAGQAQVDVGSATIAMEPLIVGQIVLRGLVNNDLYIFTHAEYAEIVRERGEVIMASFPSGTRLAGQRQLAESLRSQSIYRAELDHRACDGRISPARGRP